MSEEILINVTPRETRVAVVENGMLQELHIERGWRRGVVGNIYKGRVQRVMPGHAGGVRRHRPGPRRVPARLDIVRAAALSEPTATARKRRCRPRRRARSLELLREGQEIVVQVVKDPIGSKGARLTTQLSHSVALPRAAAAVARGRRVRAHRGRSRTRAPEDARRVAGFAGGGEHGYIVRTNAEGQPAEALAEDVAYLSRVWALVEDAAARRRASASASTKTSRCRCARCAT